MLIAPGQQHSSLQVIDSHTGGEPTRLVVAGGPDLGRGPLSERSRLLREEHDWLRRAVCLEPRGHDAMVGALLTEAHEPECLGGVIFFNNVSTLHMCIHGTIGVVATLAHRGDISAGEHRLDTPAGVVTARLHDDGSVEVANVPSYRHAANVELPVPDWGLIRGDIAWGGNWFFLIDGQGPAVEFANLEKLTAFARAVRRQLHAGKITGNDGGEIDHIEVFAPPREGSGTDSRNFVLCPGGAYDRSPCGTGTSAKLACLYADGKLTPGQVWNQAGILGTVFRGSVDLLPDGKVLPRISGWAWVTGESTYHFHPGDRFRHGIAPRADSDSRHQPNG